MQRMHHRMDVECREAGVLRRSDAFAVLVDEHQAAGPRLREVHPPRVEQKLLRVLADAQAEMVADPGLAAEQRGAAEYRREVATLLEKGKTHAAISWMPGRRVRAAGNSRMGRVPSAARWQATERPSASCVNVGSRSWQRGCANGQRGVKRQPAGRTRATGKSQLTPWYRS